MLTRSLRSGVALLLAVPALLALATTAALAHAQYTGSTPSANSTVSAVPATLQITYSEELSDIQITVTGPHGGNVTTAAARFDLENRHNASVPLRDDGPGQYTVVWHNVSGDDGDPNDGSFVLTVGGAAPAAAAPAAAATQPAANAQPAAANAPSSTTATSATTTTPCVDNGARTPGINDVRVDTYCKRQAIRDKYAGQIDVATFNAALADGQGLESALADAMADFQAEHRGR